MSLIAKTLRLIASACQTAADNAQGQQLTNIINGGPETPGDFTIGYLNGKAEAYLTAARIVEANAGKDQPAEDQPAE